MEDDAVEAAVFVNASIAFNNLTREAALRNIQSVWPTLAIIATNTYSLRKASSLFVNQQTIQSKDTTQRDPPHDYGHLCDCCLPLDLQRACRVKQCRSGLLTMRPHQGNYLT